MKKTFVENIRERDWIDSPFLVREKIMAMARNGKPYMTLKLMDRTGEVEGRVWEKVDELSDCFEKDDFVRIQGKASVYLGKMQLVVQNLERVEEEAVELCDFLPASLRSPDDLVAELREKIESLESPHLKALMESFVSDADFLRSYSRAPAAKSMHHVYLGGLLEHSLAVADLAGDVAHRYPGLNRDLLVTGALLHDIGKVAELSYLKSFDYTDEGKLLGHIVIGVEMLEEKIRSLPDFPRRLATLLKHLLLSHHGQYEYGSPKRPKTLEAIVLNFLDDMDSKINGVRTHIEKEPDSPSAWTSYHRLYDRYFLKEPFGEERRDEPSQESSPPPDRPLRPVPPRPEKGGEGRRRSFGTTLGEQLKGKNLDLFGSTEKKND